VHLGQFPFEWLGVHNGSWTAHARVSSQQGVNIKPVKLGPVSGQKRNDMPEGHTIREHLDRKGQFNKVLVMIDGLFPLICSFLFLLERKPVETEFFDHGIESSVSHACRKTRVGHHAQSLPVAQFERLHPKVQR